MRGDASVLTAHWRGHLAADFAADYVAAGEDVRHVRGQEFIDANLTLVAKFDSGFFYGDPVGVRAAAVATKSFPARNSPVGLPVSTLTMTSIPSGRTERAAALVITLPGEPGSSVGA